MPPYVLPIVATSFLLGMRHATDPDHVIAVTTIAGHERSLRRAGVLGALWGLGHTATIVLVGALVVLFRVRVTPRIGLSMEMAVAVMLVVLGVANLVGGRGGAHAHAPGGARAAAPTAAVRPLLIGVVHGLAGSAAATLLVTSLIPDPRLALAFLAVFGLGTVAGMAVVTLLVAAPAALAGGRVVRLQRGLRLASGALSVGFGLYLAWQIGWVDGLFTADPRWSPK